MFLKKSRSAKRQNRTVLRTESLEDRNLLSVNISEIHFRPTFADPLEDQYLEIRGEPNAVIPADTYFLGVESDGDNVLDNPGKINAIFDLSGLTLGSNGYLVFLQQNTGYATDANANVLQGTTGGFKGMPGDVYQGFTGQFESISGSETFVVVDTSAGSAPVLSSDIDATDDGIPDAGLNWTVLDSVTYLKEDFGTISGDLAYGDIVFRGAGNVSTVPGSATLVDMEELGYVARINGSTGYAVSDWVAGGTKETITPFVFELSDGDNGTSSPAYFGGKQLTHIGAENFVHSISGEAPIGQVVFVDRNDNGTTDNYQLVAEPDDVPPTSQLINAFPGVTLTGAGPDGEPTGFSITSISTGINNSSTGTYSFAYSGIAQFSDLFQMRMDFLKPTSEISLDFTGGSTTGNSIGALKTFDEFGTLLDTYTTSLLAGGQTETMTVTRLNPDIAYAIALVDETSPKKSGYLDYLRFYQEEEVATVDESGKYILSPVWDNQDTLLVKNLSTGNTEAVRAAELSATHVDFSGSPSSTEDVFGRATDGSLKFARPNTTTGDSFHFEDWGSLSTGVTWDDILIADVNGDGMDDVVGRTSGGQWWVAKSTGDGFVNEYWGKWSGAVTWDDVVVGDFNGDGMDDIAGRTSGQWWLAKSQGTFFTVEYWGNWSNAVTWDDVVVGDFDGDEKDDIAGRTNGQWWISHSQGTYFTVEYWGNWSNAVTWEDVAAGDFDGDDKTDIIGRTNGQWWMSRSQGSYFTVEYWGNWSNAVTWEDVKVADVNGDNQSDIVGRTNGTWWVSRSHGDYFTVENWGNWSNAVTWDSVVIADVNGDRMDDIVGVTGGTWWATVSQGSYFTVESWGNHPDSATWAHVQSADFGSFIGGSSLSAVTLSGFGVLNSAADDDGENDILEATRKPNSAVIHARAAAVDRFFAHLN